ncbi:hypothetical protein SXCC_02103 [Gluconacetobacter sp. SXCC-1]|nr:hypothetical protein SXCC_02103 [Gluconacetobacter sp. SXCC-1]
MDGRGEIRFTGGQADDPEPFRPEFGSLVGHGGGGRDSYSIQSVCKARH